MLDGFKVVPAWKRGLSDFMDKHGFATINDMKGAILPKLISQEKMKAMMETDLETKGLVVAQVDSDKCNSCERCEDVCSWEAVKLVNQKAVVDESLCEGCGLCKEICPTDAISLTNMELMKSIVARMRSRCRPADKARHCEL